MNRKFNPLAFMGLLGLVGLLGLFTDNSGLFGFFGFFGWFGFNSVKVDERYFTNLRKAGSISFMLSVIGMAILICLVSLKVSYGIIALTIAILFITIILSFYILFRIYDKRGV